MIIVYQLVFNKFSMNKENLKKKWTSVKFIDLGFRINLFDLNNDFLIS